MDRTLFRKASLDKVTSPDQLDDYIRVANPSLWVILGAIVVLLVAVLIWSAAGTLPTTLSLSGVGQGTTVVCFLSPEDAQKVSAGMKARIGDQEGAVTHVGAQPLSRKQVTDSLGDGYVSEGLKLGDWNVPVTLSASKSVTGLCPVTLTVNQTKPIRFLLN